MINPAEFISQVKRELQRVTWPSQKETIGVTIAVLVMVVCMMIYFCVADGFICWVLARILGI